MFEILAKMTKVEKKKTSWWKIGQNTDRAAIDTSVVGCEFLLCLVANLNLLMQVPPQRRLHTHMAPPPLLSCDSAVGETDTVSDHGRDEEREEVVHRLLSKLKSTGADIHNAAAYRADTGFLQHRTPLAGMSLIVRDVRQYMQKGAGRRGAEAGG